LAFSTTVSYKQAKLLYLWIPPFTKELYHLVFGRSDWLDCNLIYLSLSGRLGLSASLLCFVTSCCY